MEKHELLNLQFLPKCRETQCFFHSKPLGNCIFAGLTIHQIQLLCARRKMSIDLFMSINSCPPEGKRVIDEYKMGLLLLE